MNAKHEVEKKILPRATKSSLVKLIRAKGYDVPSIYQAVFERCRHTFWLHWRDKEGIHHWAYYTWTGGPALQIDETWIELTVAEVIHFGLYDEK